MKARVHVTLKEGVLDPQGLAIRNGLSALGFAGVDDVRQGKVFDITMKLNDDMDEPESVLADMAERLLANMVIEDYRVEVIADS